MSETVDYDMLRMRKGFAAQGTFDALADELTKLNETLERRVFAKLDAGELTLQEAFQAWAEKHAYHRLARQLTKTIRLGERAATKLTPTLNPKDTNVR